MHHLCSSSTEFVRHLGSVIWICAPRRGDGNRPAVRLHDALSDCHAKAGAFGLGGKEGLENAFLLISGESGSLIADRHHDFFARSNWQGGAANRNFRTAGRGLQRILEDVSKDLREGERINSADGIAIDLLGQVRCLPRMGLLHLAPDFHPELLQIALFSPQLERRGPLAHLLKQPMKVFLGFLNASHERQGFGTVFDLEREHFQAGFAALEGVAALVDQAGHCFADGSEALGLAGPFLGTFASGDIAR